MFKNFKDNSKLQSVNCSFIFFLNVPFDEIAFTGTQLYLFQILNTNKKIGKRKKERKRTQLTQTQSCMFNFLKYTFKIEIVYHMQTSFKENSFEARKVYLLRIAEKVFEKFFYILVMRFYTPYTYILLSLYWNVLFLNYYFWINFLWNINFTCKWKL